MSRAYGDTAATRTTAAASSGRTPVPQNVCRECGEFLPHACAPIITILRERWTGRRIVRIQDCARWHTHQPRQQAEAEPGRCGQ
jgi:hypothetical protein